MVSTLHLAYLCSGRLETWQWRRGGLTPGPAFTQDNDGIDAFADHMVALGRPPVHLLADLVEEDFHRVALPHVRGRAGRNMLARRLQQHYRETPYRRATLQGREPEADAATTARRRDDLVLMSALTNPAALQPWTAALTLVQTPLAGIWSAALLGTVLPAMLGFTQPHLLMVTWQSCGMRQSYFRDGQLKFSRLAPAQADCAAETARTHQFLVSARLLERGDHLQAVVVTHDGAIAPLSEHCTDSAEITFHFVPLAVALSRCGTAPGGAETPKMADTLMLHLLARDLPPSHYPSGADARYYRLWRARVSLYASAWAVAACALVWAGFNGWAYAQANLAAATLAEETRHFTERYRGAMAPVGPVAAPTADMRAAVLVDRLLDEQGPAPLAMLSLVSTALERAPHVQLVALEWQVAEPSGGTAARTVDGGAPATTAMPSALLGIPVRPRQSLRLEAEVRLARPDAQGAVDSMQAFARDLARHPRLTVAIEQPVLDLRPDVKLTGRASGDVPPPSPFTLRLELAP